MSRRIAATFTLFACLVALAGCGDSAASRGTSGAAIGAGTGAAVCAVTIVGILPCAIVGGALGAAGGVATAGPDQPVPVAAPAPAAAPAPGAVAPTADLSATIPQPLAPVSAVQPRVGVTAEPLQ